MQDVVVGGDWVKGDLSAHLKNNFLWICYYFKIKSLKCCTEHKWKLKNAVLESLVCQTLIRPTWNPISRELKWDLKKKHVKIDGFLVLSGMQVFNSKLAYHHELPAFLTTDRPPPLDQWTSIFCWFVLSCPGSK